MEPGNYKLNPLAPAFFQVSKTEEVMVDEKSQSEKPATQQEQNQPNNSSVIEGKIPEDEDIIDPEDEELEREIRMDMEFLLVTFSHHLSYVTIHDLYLANNGYLVETIDMLNQLKNFSHETVANRVETVNIGDVPENNAKDEANVTSSAKPDASESS